MDVGEFMHDMHHYFIKGATKLTIVGAHWAGNVASPPRARFDMKLLTSGWNPGGAVPISI